MTDRDEAGFGPPTDEEVLAALAIVLDQDEDAPADAVRAAVGAYTWHSVDAELLEVLYDSSVELLAEMRDEDAPRLMTFSLPAVEVDVELTSEREWLVSGKVTPAGQHVIHLQQAGEADVTVTSNEAGHFELRPRSDRRLRLMITIDSSGGRIVTPWIDLV
jgi:hypothetical protein